MSIWRWFKRATPPPPQHAEWPPAWRPARWQLAFDDAAVVGLARAYAEQLPGVARLESLDDPEAVLRWVASLERGAERQLTLVPSPRPHLEAFTEAASKEHQLEFGPDLVAEMLPPDEALDRWELVAIEGGEHFWFVDPTVAPRFRVVVLSFNYDHQYLDGEFVDAADLVLDALAKLRDVRPPPPDLVQQPHAPAPRAPSLEAPAQALVRALPLFGPAVSAEVARKVAGVSTPQFRFAVVQLMGHGWVAMPTLYVWDDRFSTGRELETLVVYGHPGEQPEAGMQARWNELAGEPEIELARRARREARWLDVKK